jgi:hypothetical protein
VLVVSLVLLIPVAGIRTAVERLMETPGQTQARVRIEQREAVESAARAAESERTRAARQTEEAERNERTKALCKLRSLCSKYGAVRQECAVAGNFDNCVSIKMGNFDQDQPLMCTPDGKVAFVSPDAIPNRAECFLSGVVD